MCFGYLLCEAKAVLKWRRWPAVLVTQEDALTPNGHRKVPDVRIQLFAVMAQFFRIPHLKAEEEKKQKEIVSCTLYTQAFLLLSGVVDYLLNNNMAYTTL